MKQTQQQLKLAQAKADLKSWAWHKVGENPEAISALAGHRMAEVKCLVPAPSPCREAQNWGCPGPHSHLLHKSIGPGASQKPQPNPRKVGFKVLSTAVISPVLLRLSLLPLQFTEQSASVPFVS